MLHGPGARSQVDAVSALGTATSSPTGHAGECGPPRPLELGLGLCRGWRGAVTGPHTTRAPSPPSPLPGPPTPQLLEVASRDSPSALTVGWAPAPGPRGGYRVSWHQEGGQGSPGGLVDLGPDNASLTLQGLVPGSCYAVSVWTRVGNLSASIQRARACTREFPAAASGRPALGSGVGTNILHTPPSVCLTQRPCVYSE